MSGRAVGVVFGAWLDRETVAGFEVVGAAGFVNLVEGKPVVKIAVSTPDGSTARKLADSWRGELARIHAQAAPYSQAAANLISAVKIDADGEVVGVKASFEEKDLLEVLEQLDRL